MDASNDTGATGTTEAGTLLEWAREASCSEIARMDEWAGDERDKPRAVECEE